ncbi:MAG: polynucleotide adenylyltransferase [Lachnospiraceae bacterium]|nr:polynucleotide adenylyltransferase [Lachnospiraceae bacterium]
MHIKMPDAVSMIINKLLGAGYEAYSVGGCVRDALLSRTPYDWDITTSATPDQIKRIFPRTVDTGIKHGTVTVLVRSESFEVTTYRIDGKYKDGRHPESVSFTASLTEDLLRRDFTINAMAYNDESGLVDPYGGEEDLASGTIRCVGDPIARFGEDALRMLRAIRFAACLSFVIEENTMSAIKRLAPSIKVVSSERICAELNKLLISDHPELISLLYDTGLANTIMPRLVPLFESGTAGKLLSSLSGSVPDKTVRWSVLTHFTGGAHEIMRGLRFDNKTTDSVCLLTTHSSESYNDISRSDLKKTMAKLGTELLPAWFDFLDALYGKGFSTSLRKTSNDIMEAKECFLMSSLALSGKDILSLGCPKGIAVGEVLSALLDRVTEDPSLNTPDRLTPIAGELIGNINKNQQSE